MKTIFKIFKAIILSIIVFFGVSFLVFGIGLQVRKSVEERQATSAPVPTLTQTEIDDLAQRYLDSHKNMNGKKFNLEEAKEMIVMCYKFFSGKDRCEDIIAKKFWIGMSDLWAVLSLGYPSDVNKTVTSNLVHEQYVYGNPLYGATYLYFDNGILTSYQDN